jgi:hypothetical protein
VRTAALLLAATLALAAGPAEGPFRPRQPDAEAERVLDRVLQRLGEAAGGLLADALQPVVDRLVWRYVPPVLGAAALVLFLSCYAGARLGARAGRAP